VRRDRMEEQIQPILETFETMRKLRIE